MVSMSGSWTLMNASRDFVAIVDSTLGPVWLGEKFGIILFDPPFFNAVPVSQLFVVIRELANFNHDQKMLISWPTRRSVVLLNAFHRFGLVPTGFRPGYTTVLNEGKNKIEFFGNLGADCQKLLKL
jgi:hypothetical protein